MGKGFFFNEEKKPFSVCEFGLSSAIRQIKRRIQTPGCSLNCEDRESLHPDIRTPSTPTTALICEKKALD